MEKIYIDTAKILKAISDPKRLKIVDMLSCREQCACKLQKAFAITQPTLSHDMKCWWSPGSSLTAGTARIFSIPSIPKP